MTAKLHDDMKIALYPGTFDPFTIGHLSILERALPLFDKIVIAVGVNDAKKCFSPTQQRVEDIASLMADNPKVKVISYEGLTVDVARKEGARFILRGVRSVTDFQYEQQLADINRNISGIETVLLYTLPEQAFISSSMVRELARNGYDIKKFLPQKK